MKYEKYAILTGVMAVVIGGATLVPSAVEAYRVIRVFWVQTILKKGMRR